MSDATLIVTGLPAAELGAAAADGAAAAGLLEALLGAAAALTGAAALTAAALVDALLVEELGLALLLLLLQPATRHAVATTAMVTPVRLNFIDFSFFGVAHGTGAVSRPLLELGG